LDECTAGIIALQEIGWTGGGTFNKRAGQYFYGGHKHQHILGTCFAVKKRKLSMLYAIKDKCLEFPHYEENGGGQYARNHEDELV
jgi:hypothetical protein